MSKLVNLYEAKTHLSSLIEEAVNGADIVIAKNGKAKVRLTPTFTNDGKKRVLGQWAQYFKGVDLNSDEWWREWKAMDAEIERDFYKGMEEDDQPWRTTSSTPTPSSRSKRGKSHRKRAKSSKVRKTRSG